MLPTVVEIPPAIEVPEKGKDSVERVAQEERELTALGAAYMSDAHIPDSAAEPSSQIPEDQVDREVKSMLTGPEVDALFWNSGAPAAIEPPPSTASVAELVGQLTATAPDVTMSSSGPGLPYNSYDPAILAGFGPEQLSQILQQAQASLQGSSAYPLPAEPAPTQQHPGADQNWHNAPYPPYENEEPRWNDDGWRGGGRGRGRGRGRGGFGRGDGFRNAGRRPCMFHMQGRQASLSNLNTEERTERTDQYSPYIAGADTGINAISATIPDLHTDRLFSCIHHFSLHTIHLMLTLIC